MDQIQQGIIVLLKSAVTETALALPEGFDIEAALPLIKKHHMATLCYDGAVRCGMPRAHPVMQELFQGYCKLLRISEGQMRELRRIYEAFEENNIDYMPLKGSNMKFLYPKPELRIMGDADILIRTEQYDRIVPIMESLGFTAVLESDHELTWKSSGLYLELHKHLIPSYNKDYYAYFGRGWDLARPVEGTRYAMTPEDTYIYLFTHMAKHYRDGGIGCRHVVDLWVYRRANPNLDDVYIGAELEKLQLRKFHENICRMLAVWFEDGEPDQKTQVLTDCIFASGSWGKAEDHILSQSIKNSKTSVLGFSGRWVYLCRLIFPSVKNLSQNYPVLSRAPWLYPAVWLIRIVQKLTLENGKIRKHGKVMGMLTREKLDERHRMLQYVGLDYNF